MISLEQSEHLSYEKVPAFPNESVNHKQVNSIIRKIISPRVISVMRGRDDY
jgi:hypothetical protein